MVVPLGTPCPAPLWELPQTKAVFGLLGLTFSKFHLIVFIVYLNLHFRHSEENMPLHMVSGMTFLWLTKSGSNVLDKLWLQRPSPPLGRILKLLF